jgi:DnaJ-class molecular chaperone
METIDYYDVLGLTRSCSPVDVKKAYRKLAMKYHPDKNDTDEAAKLFKDISEAYNILSDLEHRAIYDRFGLDGLKEKLEYTEGSHWCFNSCAYIFSRVRTA